MSGLTLWKNQRLLDSFFQPRFPLSAWADFSDFANAASATFAPNADVAETKEHYSVRIELPGIAKDQIKVELDKNVLTISGLKQKPTLNAEESLLFSERNFGEFRRSFHLPEIVDQEKIIASHQEGVLTIVVPKSPAAQPKFISVA